MAFANEHKKNPLFNVFNLDLTDDFENHLLKRISSWTKLIRITTWLKRFKLKNHLKSSVLTPIELQCAKFSLFWLAQADLRAPDHQNKRKKLNLVLSEDDNFKLLRIHGRLNNFTDCELFFNANPIALPAKSKITKLYAEHIHRSLGHLGYRVVLANLRQVGVFILRGKQLLKSIASKCMKCRINRRNLLQQHMGQLPPFRLNTTVLHLAPYLSIYLALLRSKKLEM